MKALLLLLALGGIAAEEQPGTQTILVVVPSAPTADAAGKLVFRSEDHPDTPPVERSMASLLVDPRVELAPGVWSLDVVSDVHWQERRYLLPGQTEVSLDLLPKSRIKGTLSADPVAPAEVRLHLTIPGTGASQAGRVVDCPVRQAAFVCGVPAGKYALRLSAAGFIARSWPAIELEAGREMDLREVMLRPGHSLFLRVRAPRTIDPTTVRVIAELRNSGRRLEARPDARGAVQIDGLGAGEYLVHATHASGLGSERVPVVIRQGAETVGDTLVLRQPRTIAARIAPPLAPGDEPWVVEVARQRGVIRQTETVASSPASDAGEWESRGLQPDEYELVVAAPGGDVWHRESILLSDAEEIRSIVLASRRIRGRVRMGGMPIAAALTFQSARGRVVTTQSDADGIFATDLPNTDEPSWTVQVAIAESGLSRTVRISLGDGADEEIIIDLPAWTLRGVVQTAAGKPVAHAVVDIAGERDLPYTQALAGDDGTFVVSGVPNGRYLLKANAGSEGESEPLGVTIADAPSAAVTLVVRPAKTLRGQIVSPNGPVAGARVHVIPRNVWVPTLHTYTTREDGSFSARLPEDVGNVDLLVSPPGFAFTTAHVPYRPQVLTVVVGQHGGTIRVHRPDSAERAVLHHDGAIIDLDGVIGYEWPLTRQGAWIVLPEMEPGLYRYCMGASCADGFLAPGGDLRLGEGPVEPSR